MRVALASDLHLEVAPITLNNTDNAEVLILSGDILTACSMHDHPEVHLFKPEPGVIWKPSDEQIRAIRYHEFLAHVSKEFPHVVYVAGNHEYYHGRFPDAITWLKTKLAEFPNIHLLEKSLFELGDLTFVGGTLWTDMNKNDPMTMYMIENRMNDFRIIKNSRHNYRRFSPQDAVACHRETLNYFRQVIDSNPSQKFVVVGHHAPAYESVHERYRHDQVMNGGYYSDLTEFIVDRPQIVLFTHGHMHDPFDYKIGETRVVCNPRGYMGYEPEAADFMLKFLDI